MSNKTDRSKYAHVIDTLGYIIALWIISKNEAMAGFTLLFAHPGVAG